MNLIRVLNKVRRELYKSLSKMCVIKHARVNYRGLNLKVPIISGFGSGYLVVGDKWMSDCLSIFLQNKAGMVVDVGVNIGLYLVNLRASDEDREYLGFEPNSFCNFYTQELMKNNGFHNARILPFALSDNSSIRAFYIAGMGAKTGSLHDFASFNRRGKYSFDVFTMSGDDFIQIINPEEICVFKIDVEGAELEVLRGLKFTLQKYKPYIFCEILDLPATTHLIYEEKYMRLVEINSFLKEINYVILAVDKSDSSIINEIISLEQFNNGLRRDYILVHDSESHKLKMELAKIN